MVHIHTGHLWNSSIVATIGGEILSFIELEGWPYLRG